MKPPRVTRKEALSLLDELRSMATGEQGPDQKRLLRATEICFQLHAQEWASRWADDLGNLLLQLEALFGSPPVRDVLNIDALRSEIADNCSRLFNAWTAGAV